MARKPRPTKVYRMESYDRPGETYLNYTTQSFNKPAGWPGPLPEESEDGRRVLYLEGTITWELEGDEPTP